jgi:hypothetical protein
LLLGARDHVNDSHSASFLAALPPLPSLAPLPPTLFALFDSKFTIAHSSSSSSSTQPFSRQQLTTMAAAVFSS